MAVNLNRVLLAGNLTRDPQVRFFANERAVANFSIATNRRYKGADGELKEETTFVDVEAWGRTAELVGQYLTKGQPCFLEGRLRLDQWEDKQTGAKRSRLLVVADSVQFLSTRGAGGGGAESGGGYGSRSEQSSDAQAPAAPSRSDPAPSYDDEEPPF
ncbi:MAG: single-stranded DNA-binding protein [Planctomycetota bacterium]|nr:MAG: single-stranded DNA-binding protein [Planctomycetota bacterium]